MTPLAGLIGAIALLRAGLVGGNPVSIGPHYKYLPTEGLSVNSSNLLQYQGSSTFWACPATDDIYNVYLHPNESHLGCVAVALQANEVGRETPLFPEYSRLSDSPTTQDLDGKTFSPSVISQRAELEPRLSALYNDWRTVKNSYRSYPDRYAWVGMDQVSDFRFRPGQSLWIGTPYFYGCTIFVAVGEEGAVFGHFKQEQGPHGASGLTSAAAFERYYCSGRPELDVCAYDVEHGLSRDRAQRFAIIMGAERPSAGGVVAFRKWCTDNGVAAGNVRYLQYAGSSGTGEPNPASPYGLGLVKWTSRSAAEGATATLEVFLSSEAAVLTTRYVMRGGRFVLLR